MRSQRGSASVEMALLTPLFILILAAAIGGGRAWMAHAAVQHLADAGSRAASIARSPSSAQADAAAVVESDATASGLRCAGGLDVQTDVSGFAIPVGSPATVTVRVRCAVDLGDLALPGHGVVEAHAESTSVLDRYRARG